MRERQDWPGLAIHVAAGRIRAGYRTLVEFAQEIGVSERTVGRLENGKSVGRNTLGIVERALGWTPGSAQRVLDGGKPTGREAASRTASPGDLAEMLEREREQLIAELGEERGQDEFAAVFQRTLDIRRESAGPGPGP